MVGLRVAGRPHPARASRGKDHAGCSAPTLRSEMIAIGAQDARNHGLALLLLCLPGLAGCGSPAEEERIQRVAFCQGSSSDNAQGDPFSVELRQGSTVVARGSGSVGTAFTFEVPAGAITIYVEGVQKGSVNEGVDPDAYHSPGPDDVTYIATGEGCPESAPLPPS